jgi:exopolysaccharide biosynthesis polyprenyl glycosylphosphotransferase
LAWVSFVLGLLLLATFSSNPVNQYNLFSTNVQHGFWFPVGIVLGFAVTGAFRMSRRSPSQSTFSDMKDFFISSVVGAFLALTMSYIAHHFGDWSIKVPTQIIVAVFINIFLVALYHASVRYVVLRRSVQHVAVVDDGSNYGRIATHLHLQHGVTLVGRIDPTTAAGPDTLGSIMQIDALVAIHKLDRVIFGTIEPSSPELEHAYRRATELVDTALVPKMYEVISWRSRLTELSGLPLLELAPRNVSWFDQTLKRTFDIAVSLVVLTVTLPLTLAIALTVKFTSRGPILFRQERLGRDRRPFTILKFRTLRVDTFHQVPGSAFEPNVEGRHTLYEARNKAEIQDRLTPVGHFLRRSGLDELPQFFNVLVGSMSVVGPRPFVISESDQHNRWSERRFEVRPGITGLWQVSGRNNLTEAELRQLDYLYVSAWSLWWDVKICFDTPRAMVRGLGAY